MRMHVRLRSYQNDQNGTVNNQVTDIGKVRVFCEDSESVDE
jgi:hypothetical protein